MTRAVITGTAGFIGFHLAELLLQEGWKVAGYDSMTDHVATPKEQRHVLLTQHQHSIPTEAIEADSVQQTMRNDVPIQAGDILATWADASLRCHLNASAEQTGFREGLPSDHHHVDTRPEGARS